MTPERAKLAAAVANVAEVQRQIDRANEARHRAHAALDPEAVDTAEHALKEARENQGRTRLASLMGDPAAAQTVEQAEAALVAARRGYDAARNDLVLVDEEIERIQGRLEWARLARTDALVAVIAAEPGVAALLREWDEVRARAVTIGKALAPLWRGLPSNWNYIKEFEADANYVAMLAGWAKALETDAAAPFPTDPPPAPAQAKEAA